MAPKVLLCPDISHSGGATNADVTELHSDFGWRPLGRWLEARLVVSGEARAAHEPTVGIELVVPGLRRAIVGQASA